MQSLLDESFLPKETTHSRELQLDLSEQVFLSSRLLHEVDQLDRDRIPPEERNRSIGRAALISGSTVSISDVLSPNNYRLRIGIIDRTDQLSSFSFSQAEEHGLWTTSTPHNGTRLAHQEDVINQLNDELDRPIFDDLLDRIASPQEMSDRLFASLASRSVSRSIQERFIHNQVFPDTQQLSGRIIELETERKRDSLRHKLSICALHDFGMQSITQTLSYQTIHQRDGSLVEAGAMSELRSRDFVDQEELSRLNHQRYEGDAIQLFHAALSTFTDPTEQAAA